MIKNVIVYPRHTCLCIYWFFWCCQERSFVRFFIKWIKSKPSIFPINNHFSVILYEGLSAFHINLLWLGFALTICTCICIGNCIRILYIWYSLIYNTCICPQGRYGSWRNVIDLHTPCRMPVIFLCLRIWGFSWSNELL